MKNSILVVDDEVGILIAFRKILEHENFFIITSAYPREALEIISTQNPQLVILDIKMPEISGYSLLRQIKKRYPKIPVMIMTAYSNIFTEQDILQMGADGYLKKPFEIQEMLTKVKQFVNYSEN